jgi:hypothetical protein
VHVNGENVEVPESVRPRVLSLVLSGSGLLDFHDVKGLAGKRLGASPQRSTCELGHLSLFPLQLNLYPGLFIRKLVLQKEVVCLIARKCQRLPIAETGQDNLLENGLSNDTSDAALRYVGRASNRTENSLRADAPLLFQRMKGDKLAQVLEHCPLFCFAAPVYEAADLCHPISFGHLGCLPGGSGSNFSISRLRTSSRPPILSAGTRPRFTKRAMACLDTPRIRAASACEIHSSGQSGNKLVDIDNLL